MTATWTSAPEHGWRALAVPARVRLVGVAVLVAVVQVGITFAAAHTQPEARELDAPAVGLLVAASAALLVRRRLPVLALVPRTVWAPHAVQDVDAMVMVEAAEGTSVAEAKEAVTRVADRFGGPEVEDRTEFASTMTTGVDMMLGIIYALLALAIVIALMGIANTLSLSIHERTRELGLLRAVGQTRRQVRSMVRWESVVIATFGTVAGIGLGVFLGWALVQAVGTASGGLGVFALPAGRLAVVLVVGALAGVLAGLRPARRAARLDVLTAIGTE